MKKWIIRGLIATLLLGGFTAIQLTQPEMHSSDPGGGGRPGD